MDSPTSFVVGLLLGFMAGALFVAWLIRHVLQPVAQNRTTPRSPKKGMRLLALLLRAPGEPARDLRPLEPLDPEASRALEAPRFPDAQRARAKRKTPKKNRR